MLSTERRCHDVLVMFGDVIYDVRNVHWRVNNKIKRKFTLFQWTPKKFSSRVMKTFTFSLLLRTRENTDVFITLDENIFGIHSKRVNILYLFLHKNICFGYSLEVHQWGTYNEYPKHIALTLLKHAYPKTYWYFSYFSTRNICCGYSLCAFNKYPQHMFFWRNTKTNLELCVLCWNVSLV